MGCFFVCFGNPKHHKCKKKLLNVVPQSDQSHEAPQPTPFTIQENLENPIKPREKLDEQLKCIDSKKVTFDLNVKTYEDVCTEEVLNDSFEGNVEKEEKKEEQAPKESQSFLNLIKESIVSYPPNYRYQNFTNNDDEYEGLELEENDLDDDDDENNDNNKNFQGESSESLFSLSIESRGQAFVCAMDDKEVNSPMPKHGSHDQEMKTIGLKQNLHSVLKPVENLTEWNAVKAEFSPPLKNHQEKENINLEQNFTFPISSEPSFRLSNHNAESNSNTGKPFNQEVAVDTSLSSWLVESETTTKTKTSSNLPVGNSHSESKNSSVKYGDRPILGALTVEELKQASASSSPRRSPSRSPDEIPIIGTVGSYWSHTGQAMDSHTGSSSNGRSKSPIKYREDQIVNWNSTPFEIRLERALDRGTAEI